MCLHDLLARLRAEGLAVTEGKVRWALKTGKVSRPALDGSLRLDWSEMHVRQLLEHFARHQREGSRGHSALPGRRKPRAGGPWTA
jgi:hypothetical protein